MPEMTARGAAELCGGTLDGDGDVLLYGANTLEDATPRDIAFADGEKGFPVARKSRAGCVVVPPAFERDASATLIVSANPRTAFAEIVKALYARAPEPAHIHPTAVIHESVVMGDNCSIGAFVTIDAGTVIADGCRIAAGCRVGSHVAINANSVLHPNVTLYDGVKLGARVVVHSGSVIGADGFGYTFERDHYEKFPQVGSVEVGDDVEIGANCCIDRAALGTTRIGDGTKLDNLVHVAHNCTLGRHVVVAAQTGFSGSVSVGDYAVIGGQAGIGEKAKIASKAVLGGKCGVLTGQRIEAGEPVWGIPARPLKQHLRNLAHVSRLPRTEAELTQVRKRLEAVENGQSRT